MAQAEKRRRRHPRAATLPGPPQHHAHSAVYRATLRPLRWVLEGLILKAQRQQRRSARALFERGKMDELTLLAVAEAIKAETGVIHHRILDPTRKDGYVTFGLAFPQRKIIHAPEGRTPKDLYLLAHECAHVALRHDHQKPRHVREYEAEMWAHAALPRHGVAIPEDSTAEAMLNV